MKQVFLNGNQQQQDACKFAARALLHLPFSGIPLEHEIEFISDPDPKQHNEFAITEYKYGSHTALTKIGKVAPHWGGPYNDIRFLNETYVHELGHALFAVLPKSFRVAIAKMFGAKGDELSELQPDGSPWEDRYIEGIAETFKDAFLPHRYRLFTNRTNRHLSIVYYPKFRRLFREGMAASGDLGPGEEAVDEVDLDVARAGGKRNNTGILTVFTEALDVIDGGGGFHKSVSTLTPFFEEFHDINVGFEGFINLKEIWVLDGSVIKLPLILPEVMFDPAGFGAPITKQTDWWFIWTKHPGDEFSGSQIVLNILFEHFADAKGGPITPKWIVRHNPSMGETLETEVLPPYDISISVPVNSFFPITRKCGGKTYRRVHLEGWFGADTTLKVFEASITHAELRQNVLVPWLPNWPLHGDGCPSKGAPVIIPPPSLTMGDSRVAVHPNPEITTGVRK